jgi:PAS domain S-box-containing protein
MKTPLPQCHRLAPYALAIAAPGIALLLSLWLQPLLVRSVGAFFYIAVVLSTWYGGIRPGMVTIGLSVLAINYFFTPPLYQFTIRDPADMLRSGIFLLVAFVINLLNSDLRRSQQRNIQLNQQLLQESDNRLRRALASAQMGLWDWNLVTEEIVWSPEHEQLLGLAPGKFDGRYETFEACVHPDDRAGLKQAVESALCQHSVYQHEYRVIWPDGSVHWIEGRGQAVYDTTGRPLRMSGTVLRIDDRKQNEFQRQQLVLNERSLRQAAEAAQARLEAILESISDGFIMLDTQWRYVYVNQKAGQLVDRRPEELIGKNIWTEFPEAVERAFYSVFSKALAEQEPSQLEEYYPPWRRWFENRIYPSEEGLTVFFQDITDRKQAEAALRESEERWQLAIAGNNDGIWDHNLLTNQHFLSPRCLEMTGYPIDAIDTFDKWLSLVHPDDVSRLQETFQQHLQTRHTKYTCEYRLRVKDGQYRWLLARGQAHWDEAGVPVRAVGSLTDITERRKAEAEIQQLNAELEQRVAERTAELLETNACLLQSLSELQRSKQEIEDLYNRAPCGYHSLDATGTLVRINDTELNWLGYSRDEVLNKVKFSDLLAPESQVIFRRCFPIFKQQGWINNLEFQVIKKDGSTLWVNLNATAIVDESGRYIMSRSTLFDISERKLVEEALKQSEAKFRSLSESSPIGIFMTDLMGKTIYTNPRAQEICGYTFEEALGDGWMQFIHPADLQRVLEQAQSLLGQHRGGEFEDVRHVHRDGTIRYGRVQFAPIWGENRDFLGYVGTIEDVTKQHEIDQMKSEFISIVSHELRTPLTSMQAALSLLVENIINPSSDEGKIIIQIASDGVDRLVRLVNDILDLERLNSGKIRLEKRSCSVADLLETAVDQMQEMAVQSGVTLKLQVIDCTIEADADRLLQVVTNLLSNAIKFSPSDSTVQVSAGFLNEKCAETAEFEPVVKFMVQDQGRGIPANYLETIFERFQQVDASDAREKGGTGLGLAICQNIVEQHGGRIWVESVLEQGSTFYFTIPIQACDRPEQLLVQ